MSGGLRGLGIDFDSVEATHQQAEILRTKQAIREIYQDTYRELVELCERHFRGVPGKLLEIGSGGGFFKDVCPQVITSDAKDLPFVDMRLDGETLPFASGELRCIFAVHVLHHIPDIRAFLREALRVLQPGGGLICVEPYWSPLAQFVYRRFHTEPFDMRAASWDMQRGGPMTTANQALSYLLLERDRQRFAAEFPELRLVYRRLHGFLRYLFSGGMWLPQRAPAVAFPLLKALDRVATPLMPLVALHHTFVWQTSTLNGSPA